MMIDIFISAIHFIVRILLLVILADVVVSYFLSPYHSIRQFLDRIVGPLLAPIRRLVPPVQMIDFSPLILILLVYLVEYFLVQILFTLR
jgi:YggT family protein